MKQAIDSLRKLTCRDGKTIGAAYAGRLIEQYAKPILKLLAELEVKEASILQSDYYQQVGPKVSKNQSRYPNNVVQYSGMPEVLCDMLRIKGNNFEYTFHVPKNCDYYNHVLLNAGII